MRTQLIIFTAISLLLVGSTVYVYQREQAKQAENELENYAVSCGKCGWNAVKVFTACPAAVAEDGLNPWVDYSCVSNFMNGGPNCKSCICELCDAFGKRVKGC
ncbi:hypothetical protein ABPG74_000367 [Tetrahymena malaccensis]